MAGSFQFAEIATRLKAFVNERVLPAESEFATQSSTEAWGRPPVLDRLRDEAREQDLFHLFSATRAAEFPFTIAQMCRLAEITGHSPLLAQDAVGSLNPDAEVINLLHRFGTEEQQSQWLSQLRDGRIGSALCITEPDVASSDPAGLATTALQDGSELILNGKKSWALGASSPICELLVVVAVTGDTTGSRGRHSILLVPRRSPGVTVGESATFFGYRNEARGGLPRVDFHSVRVPVENLLGTRGDGFAVMQTALGPARLFHCMRLVGVAERALELMYQRLEGRLIRGRPLLEHGLWLDRIADARIRIEQARALSLAAAVQVDAHGIDSASVAISIAKAAVPASVEHVVDMAIQAHGADGMSHQHPLATLWAQARTLRFSDGPDEAHRMAIARAERKRHSRG